MFNKSSFALSLPLATHFLDRYNYHSIPFHSRGWTCAPKYFTTKTVVHMKYRKITMRTIKNTVSSIHKSYLMYIHELWLLLLLLLLLLSAHLSTVADKFELQNKSSSCHNFARACVWKTRLELWQWQEHVFMNAHGVHVMNPSGKIWA